MMGIVMPEKCWAYKKYNKIISGIKQAMFVRKGRRPRGLSAYLSIVDHMKHFVQSYMWNFYKLTNKKYNYRP